MNIFERIILEPFDRFYEKLLRFLPNLLTSLVLLVIGILLGIFVKWAFTRILKAMNVDGLSQKSGLSEALIRGGIKDPLSVMVSRVLKWFTIITFIIVAMQNLSIPTVEHLIDRIFLYLPNILIAGCILIVGYLLGNFFGRAALIASVNAGTPSAGMVGKAVKFIVLVLSCTMALEQLGIGKETITIAFAIVFGGVVFALAIAFGFGGRSIAEDYLRKKMKAPEKEDNEIDYL